MTHRDVRRAARRAEAEALEPGWLEAYARAFARLLYHGGVLSAVLVTADKHPGAGHIAGQALRAVLR